MSNYSSRSFAMPICSYAFRICTEKSPDWTVCGFVPVAVGLWRCGSLHLSTLWALLTSRIKDKKDWFIKCICGVVYWRIKYANQYILSKSSPSQGHCERRPVMIGPFFSGCFYAERENLSVPWLDGCFCPLVSMLSHHGSHHVSLPLWCFFWNWFIIIFCGCSCWFLCGFSLQGCLWGGCHLPSCQPELERVFHTSLFTWNYRSFHRAQFSLIAH